MGNLAQLKKRFFIVIGILAAVNLVLLAYLLWPGTSSASQKNQEDNLQQQYRTLSREVAPLKGIDVKLLQTRADLKTFYEERVPSKWSQISSRLQKLEQETGVKTQGVRYQTEKQDKGDLPDIQRISVETSVSGEYGKVARFINAMEQDKVIFIIEQISLTSQDAGTVTLQIKCQTFLKEAA